MRTKQVVLIMLLGTYVNIAAFGFEYGGDNQQFELALVNWLRNPSLYPGDPITEGFARYPTFFWPVVAYVSNWLDTQFVLFTIFLLTKLLFFLALTRLVAKSLQDSKLIACIVCAVALSPILNTDTPLSNSDVLNSIQTHTSLAIALLLWVGCFLVEEHWFSAALLLGFTAYINGLFVMFVFFAFAGFVLVDWRQHKRKILLAAMLLIVIVLPCLALSRGTFPTSFPKNYVEVILTRFPGHYILHSHSLVDLLHGLAMILVPASMIVMAPRLGVTRHHRLELLIGFSLLPFLLGAFVGELFPVPSLIRLHLLRSESFLLLYSVILVQIYGGKILLSTETKSPAAIWLVGVPAVLWAFDGFALPILLIAGLVIVLDPQVRFERLCRHLAQSWATRTVAVMVILAGVIIEVRLLSGLSSPGLIAALAAVGGVCYAYVVDSVTGGGVKQSKLALAVCGLVLLAATVGSIHSSARLWNPVIAPGSVEVAWREVQQWAKANTTEDTKFLVPPVPGGFRTFSERVSWVEWKDGVIIFTVPSYANEWVHRMSAIGVRFQPFLGSYRRMQSDYKEQSWTRLSSVAREEKINYIVQFKQVPYGIPPVFANDKFAVYRVLN